VRGKIFISYRRDDAPGDARGIRDTLVRAFGKSNVFMDVDNLLAGQRFDKELEKALSQCDVLIAIIGPHWMQLLSARAQSTDGDYVRDEIAAALKRGIVVIPVRVGQEGKLPSLPRREELPEDIRDLFLHQKHDVTNERFHRDVADLAAALSVIRRADHDRRPAWLIAAGMAVTALVIGVGVVGYRWIDAESSRRVAEVAARQNAEAEAARRASEAEALRRELESARERAEGEARRKADEDARRKAEEEARRKAEEDAKRKAEEDAGRKADEEAQRKAEEDARRKADHAKGSYLGVRIQEVTTQIAEALGMMEARGALVVDVAADGPAKEAGIERGDVIVSFGSKEIKVFRDLPRIVADIAPGKSVPVVVIRRGKELTMVVRLAVVTDPARTTPTPEPSPPNPAVPESATAKVLGLDLASLTGELRERYRIATRVNGVVVTAVDTGSSAAEKRLRAGDVIVEVGQVQVTTPANVQARVEQLRKEGRKSALLLVVDSEGKSRFVALPLS
jgi:C-terminal processing protease CtpA/Prc